MSSNRFIKLGIACVGGVLPVVAATPAVAQETEEVCYDPCPIEPVYEEDDDDEGISLSVGGGVEGFTDADTADMLEAGGSWDVRAHFGTRSVLGIEAAYIGSAQGVDVFGLEDEAFLVSNGAEAALRINILPDMNINPYVYVGAAWRRYDLTNTDDIDTSLSPIEESDDVFEAPLGGGVAWYISDVVVDVRGQFRATFDNDLLDDLRDDDDLHRWGVTGSVGYSF